MRMTNEEFLERWNYYTRLYGRVISNIKTMIERDEPPLMQDGVQTLDNRAYPLTSNDAVPTPYIGIVQENTTIDGIPLEQGDRVLVDTSGIRPIAVQDHEAVLNQLAQGSAIVSDNRYTHDLGREGILEFDGQNYWHTYRVAGSTQMNRQAVTHEYAMNILGRHMMDNVELPSPLEASSNSDIQQQAEQMEMEAARQGNRRRPRQAGNVVGTDSIRASGFVDSDTNNIFYRPTSYTTTAGPNAITTANIYKQFRIDYSKIHTLEDVIACLEAVDMSWTVDPNNLPERIKQLKYRDLLLQID